MWLKKYLELVIKMNLQKQDRDYYTFLEIIIMLRDEYNNVFKLLDDLSKNITIDSKYSNSFDMRLALKDEFLNVPRVVLFVSKKTNSPGVVFRKFMNKYFYDDLRRIIDNATFILDDSDEVSFRHYRELHLKNEFSPNVSIIDENKFCEDYNKLRESSIFKLPFLQIKVNSNQRLFIGGESINLVTYDGYDKLLNIKYDGCSDDIKIDSNIRYNNFLIEELLNTEISKSMLPNEYISLFSNNENNTNIEFNGDMSGRKDEVLEFVEKPKTLYLIKKNYK